MQTWKLMLGPAVLLALVGLAACGGGEATPAPAPAPAPAPGPAPSGGGDIANGAALFASLQCKLCHGDNAQGGAFPGRDDVTVPKIGANVKTFDDFKAQVRTPKQLMPPVNADRASDADLADIWAWINSLGG